MEIKTITLENFPFLKKVDNVGIDEKGALVAIDKAKNTVWIPKPAKDVDIKKLNKKKIELGMK